MKHLNFRNNWRSPITSITGLILMGAAVYVYLVRPDSELFCLTLLALGAVAFGLKDPRIPPSGGLIPLFFILLLTSSCVNFKKCADKFGGNFKVTVTDTVRFIDTTYVQADSIQGSVLVKDLESGKVDSLVHISSSQKLQIKLWYDKYNGLLHYRADVLPDTIIQYKDRIVTVDCPAAVVFDPEKGAPTWHRWLNRYKNFSAWALLLMILAFIVYLKFSK